MTAFYNEHDPFAAQWLRNLIAAGHIAPGVVDERDIRDIEAYELLGYTQCHFFAGIGVWSHALRRAGWSDDRPIWTGSCPCQPFSNAGKKKGFGDDRHLWPAWFALIEQCRPPVVVGEQVASAEGLAWLSGAGTDLQKVRDREALLGVLRELEGADTHRVQGLLSQRRAVSESRKTGPSFEIARQLAEIPSRLRLDEYSEAQGEGSGNSLRFRSEGYTASDRPEPLRTHGNTVRSGDAMGLERTFTGSDRSGEGLYENQCSRGSSCDQCDGEHLGTGEDTGDCGCDRCATESAKRAIASLFDREVETEIRPEQSSVFADLERTHYAVGASDLCAAGFQGAHIRQRLYFAGLAHALPTGRPEWRSEWRSEPRDRQTAECSTIERLADDDDAGSQGRNQRRDGAVERTAGPAGVACRLADSDGWNAGTERQQRSGEHGQQPQDGVAGRLADDQRDGQHRAGQGGSGGRCEPPDSSRDANAERPYAPVLGRNAADWLYCRDGKWRPVEPGTFPLVDAAPSRVGRLRAFGNALDAETAFNFCAALREICDGV